MFLKNITIYVLIIVFFIIICIKKRNLLYGYTNIETFINCSGDDTEFNKEYIRKDSDKEYIRIIKCDTEKLKDNLNKLNKYYIYTLLEKIFLKKTEINVLSTLVKYKNKCDNNCAFQSKRTINLLIQQIDNLNKLINDLEIINKDSFIIEQLKCITKNNINAQKECLNIIEKNYNNNSITDEDIKKECINIYKNDEDKLEICQRSTNEINFDLTKNKCIEKHKVNENECIKIPEEIEFMTQPNIIEYIKDIETQIKQQEPKLNRFLCYKCINKMKS
jgi:vacuolar-type H+-ATPase subunit I/STV1